MPRKKSFRRKKSRSSRKKRGNARSFQLSGMRSPLPKKFVTKLVYSDSFTLNPASASVANHVFTANGLFDPNITGAGHQPRGFDQIMTMFDHYVVIGSKMVARFSNPNNSQAIFGGIVLRDSQDITTNVRDWEENGYVRTVMVSSSNGTGGSTLTYACNPSKFLGRSKPLSDSQLKGSVISNPTEQAYFHVGSWPIDAASDLSVLACNITIEYIVAFIEPKNPTIS